LDPSIINQKREEEKNKASAAVCRLLADRGEPLQERRSITTRAELTREDAHFEVALG
jgi:hypothetical protein